MDTLNKISDLLIVKEQVNGKDVLLMFEHEFSKTVYEQVITGHTNY
jgi:hypothetical protein